MIQQRLHLLWAEVGNANVSRLALLDEKRHRAPGVQVVDVSAPEPAVLDGPVHVVEVEVADAEFREGFVETGFDLVGVVAGLCEYTLDCSGGWRCFDLLIVPSDEENQKVSLNTSN